MKITKILSGVIAVLMLVFSVSMFMQISDRGFLHISENIAFDDPKDLGNACLFAVVLILPFYLLLLYDEQKQTKRVLFAPLISLLLLVCFPIPIEGRVFMNNNTALDAAGKPVKRERAYFSFEPFWDRDYYYHVPQRLSSYEAHKEGVMWSVTGNHFFSQMKRYEINKYNKYVEEQYQSDYVYECLTDKSTNVLGFVWRDIRGGKFIYQYDGKLPEKFCRMIKNPYVKADTKQTESASEPVIIRDNGTVMMEAEKRRS